MTLEKQCALASQCKLSGQEQHCNITCYPYVLTHGASGGGGIWGTTGVPAKYKNCFLSNLPIKEDNLDAYETVVAYVSNILQNVEKGIGLFLYARPTPENRLGTGTGKTTSAVTILNEYVVRRIIQHIKKERSIDDVPALFVKASDFQNLYNSQFRGTQENQEKASDKYYAFKERMKTVELLVLDDIAIRGVTEAFENELTEVIDARTDKGVTIFTSNHSLKSVEGILGERIASRIAGMTISIEFSGKDHRKVGVLR